MFLGDVDDGLWVLCPLSAGLLRRVESIVLTLPPHIFLRAGDAIHLLSARDAACGLPMRRRLSPSPGC